VISFRLVGVLLLAVSMASVGASAEPSDESAALRAAQAAANRQGDRLILHTQAGKDVVFLDETRCEPPDFDLDHCILHRLVVADLEHRAFVVENDYYEARNFDWVSATNGNRIKLPGIPAYAPDGKRFLVIYNDEMHGEQGIQIWHVERDEATLEWSDNSSDYAPAEFRSWQGNSEVDLTVFVFGPEANRPRPARLTFDTKRGWHLTVEDADR